MGSIYAGPFVPNGDPMALELELQRQQRERDASAPGRAVEAMRRELEASGEIDAFVQSKIDERLNAAKDEVNNGE